MQRRALARRFDPPKSRRQQPVMGGGGDGNGSFAWPLPESRRREQTPQSDARLESLCRAGGDRLDGRSRRLLGHGREVLGLRGENLELLAGVSVHQLEGLRQRFHTHQALGEGERGFSVGLGHSDHLRGAASPW